MKKISWIIVVLITLSCVSFVYFYHQPERIEREHKSVIYSVENDFEKQTSIALEGNYYRNLFGRDVFIGKLMTDDDLEYEIKLYDEGGNFQGSITTLNSNNVTETIGSVMTSRHFDNVWVQLDNINERYNLSDGYITGPATTKEEANQVALKMQEGKKQ
ncbi:hypothetical protein D3P08_09675 [Paenibacillus nanensis]|uniref:Lipoprotein n=1 Tax=Paenibacillus nanensis TaxID=393251 RepID=A0A3A1V8B9_9BACL|nr:hypothetical protein [Paenibacillus nanensis]RIX53680.1 hypothetical protein D3P08_09675 [Paenibacillus nanensis]